MKPTVMCISFVLGVAVSLIADSNLHIDDVGLHGYYGTTSAVRLTVRNASAQPQSIHLQIAMGNPRAVTNTVTTEVSLSGDEMRQLELPVLIPGGTTKITAGATTPEGAVIGHDGYEQLRRQTTLIVLMCAGAEVCSAMQSRIQFSGTVEERADKNRKAAFEVVSDPRDHWWAYSAGSAIVLAMPTARLTPEQRQALEDYLRRGGRLVLLEREIADPSFLSAYRQKPLSPDGQRVSRGTLFRVEGLASKTLGAVFAGSNLSEMLQEQDTLWDMAVTYWLSGRFAASFSFPRLRWLLAWLAAYIVVVGVLNFAILRRLHRLEWGWVTVCLLALVFAAGFYWSSASRRPREFRLDNLAVYYLDSRSPLAAAQYALRVSAPERRDILVSIANPAVPTASQFNSREAHSQIWAEMNRQGVEMLQEYDIHLGPPRRLHLSLLKWSYRDVNFVGLHRFPGTVHFVAPNRLRNDTGQQFRNATYIDYDAHALYPLPTLAPGGEVQLEAIKPRAVFNKEKSRPQAAPDPDPDNDSLQQFVLGKAYSEPRIFVGLADGPALPVELNVAHQRIAHSLVVVALEQP